MPDLLVPLYKLPNVDLAFPRLRNHGVIIRRANTWELSATRAFIERHFTVGWADEASVGFANKPVSVWIAIDTSTPDTGKTAPSPTDESPTSFAAAQILGFAAHECTRRNFFGPTGVAESARGRGIGAALLHACLSDQRNMGYAYCVIGGAGPVAFYAKECAAVEIGGSTPGIYAELLKKRANAG